MRSKMQAEIEAFLRAKAPGLTLTWQENPAFNSVTIGLGLKVDLRKLISQAQMVAHPEEVGDLVMEMLAEVQKAVVTSIGLEEYVRERELAVLDRLQERIGGHDTHPDESVIVFQEAREELGG